MLISISYVILLLKHPQNHCVTCTTTKRFARRRTDLGKETETGTRAIVIAVLTASDRVRQSETRARVRETRLH